MIAISFNTVCERMKIHPDDLPGFCRDSFQQINTNYTPLATNQRDAHIHAILKRIEEGLVARTTEANLAAFEAGWHENYLQCAEQGINWETLRPKYVKPFSIVRLNQEFVAPNNPFLPDDLLLQYVQIAAAKYLVDVDHIIEFGCGTGRFLHRLTQLFPNKHLIGTDWTQASLKLLTLMSESGCKVTGRIFDLTHPDASFNLPKNSAVITIGALEQIGSHHRAFTNYLLLQRPSVVIHLEPIHEFYNPDNLVDYLADVYHHRRKYLQGYWTRLRALETEGQLCILSAQRMFSGDPFHESSSLIVWKPS